MKIGIAGLGLIGGSLAKALSQKTDHHVIGYDTDPQAVKAAYEQGAVHAVSDGRFSEADMVLVALYPRDTVNFIENNLSQFKSGCLIIDMCGVKRYITDSFARFDRKDIFHIGGHPMAGKEVSGYTYATANLFENMSMVLTPVLGTPAALLTQAENFFSKLGFNRVTFSTPQAHDEMIALTSQLAHIVSSAYVQAPAAMAHKGYSAGSFNDMTRVAQLNEKMWTELFLLNADYLADEIDGLIHRLTSFKDAISGRNADELFRILAEGRRRKELLNQEWASEKSTEETPPAKFTSI